MIMAFKLSELFLYSVYIVIYASLVRSEDVTVKTAAGTFIGFTDDITRLDGSASRIAKFVGIPYAEAPVGELRFRKTVLKSPLTEPFEAKNRGNACLYVNFVGSSLKGSEDCLFLNIYAPVRDNEDEKIAVMVWIHGGGFVFGSPTTHQYDQLAASGPVVVVTLSYRLTVWGFLSTEDDESPGNYGLWDQHTAIRWVHENIEAFGGDTNRITLFGESAGAASVIYQGLYSGNQGLFQRIIAQSGSPAGSWAETTHPATDTAQFAAVVGCESESSKEMLACLRNLPFELIDSAMNNFSNGLFRFPLPHVPTTDGVFVETSPSKIFDLNLDTAMSARDAFSSLELLTGINSEEGIMSIRQEAGITDPDNFLPDMAQFKGTIKRLMTLQYGQSPSDLVLDAVVAEYTPWDDPEDPIKLRQQLISMNSDMYFLDPLYRTVALHASVAARQPFMYYFDIKPFQHYIPTPNWSTGANHADDLIFLFGDEPGKTPDPENAHARPLEEWEREASADLMTLWTNFAKTGNPNKPRDLGIDWLPFTSKHRHYLEIKRPVSRSQVKSRLFDRKRNFFGKILPALRNSCSAKEPETEAEGTCSKGGDCPP